MVIMKTCNFLCCIELRWSHSCTKQAEQTIALFVSRFVIAARQVIFRGKQQVTVHCQDKKKINPSLY